MNFRSLEYFLIIVEEGNLSRAAQRLFVSQQALSEHIKKLEDETHAVLLRRSGGISLTEAGKRFLDGAKEVLRARDAMLTDVTVSEAGGRAKLVIGFRRCEPPDFLPEVLSRFASEHPECDCVVLPGGEIARSREKSSIDLYFSSAPLDEGMENIPILEEKEYAVVASRSLLVRTYGDRFAGLERRLVESKDLGLLKDLPFAVMPKRRGKSKEDRADVFARAGFTPIVGFQSDSEDLNASICACGLAAYIGPLGHCRQKFAQHLQGEESLLSLYPIIVPGMATTIAISYDKGKQLQAPEKSFIETARTLLQKQ